MKKYIFIMPDIHMVGGAQNYLRTKILYLIAHDWMVYCLFPGERGGNGNGDRSSPAGASEG